MHRTGDHAGFDRVRLVIASAGTGKATATENSAQIQAAGPPHRVCGRAPVAGQPARCTGLRRAAAGWRVRLHEVPRARARSCRGTPRRHDRWLRRWWRTQASNACRARADLGATAMPRRATSLRTLCVKQLALCGCSRSIFLVLSPFRVLSFDPKLLHLHSCTTTAARRAAVSKGERDEFQTVACPLYAACT